MLFWLHSVDDKDDYLDDPEIKDLYDEYNEKFPDYPLPDSFFEDTYGDEIMEKLESAIRNNVPIGRSRVLK